MYWVKISAAPKEYNIAPEDSSAKKKYDKLRCIDTIWQDILRAWHSDLMKRSQMLLSPKLNNNSNNNNKSMSNTTTIASSSYMNSNVDTLCVLPPPVQEWLEIWFANPPSNNANNNAMKKGNQSKNTGDMSTNASSAELKLMQAKKQTIVDSKRAQNILIVLGRVRRAPSEIKKLVLKLSQKHMTAELTANLLNILPSPEEMQQLQGLLPTLRDMHAAKMAATVSENSNNATNTTNTTVTITKGDTTNNAHTPVNGNEITNKTETIAPEESWIGEYVDLPTSFLYFMSTVPKCAQRLQCHEQMFHWSHNMHVLHTQFLLLQTACDEIVSGWEMWTGVLGVILALGNAMNAGNSRFGDAQAVKLELLEKLPTMKCTVLPNSSSTTTSATSTTAENISSTDAAHSASAIIQQSVSVPVWQKLKPTTSPSTSFVHLLAMILCYAEDAAVTPSSGILLSTNMNNSATGVNNTTVNNTESNISFSSIDAISSNNSKSTAFSVHKNTDTEMSNNDDMNLNNINSDCISNNTNMYSIAVKKTWLTSLTSHWKALWAVPEMSVKQLLIDLQQLDQQMQFADEQLTWVNKQQQVTKKCETVSNSATTNTSTNSETISPRSSNNSSKSNNNNANNIANMNTEEDAEDGYKLRLETFLAEAKPLLLRVKAQVATTEENIAVLMAKFLENYYDTSSEGGNKSGKKIDSLVINVMV